MVLVQRRPSKPPSNRREEIEPIDCSSIFSIGFGDGQMSQYSKIATIRSIPSPPYSQSIGRFMLLPSKIFATSLHWTENDSNSLPSSRRWKVTTTTETDAFSNRADSIKATKWMIKIIYSIAAVSWLASRVRARKYSTILSSLESQLQTVSIHIEQVRSDNFEVRQIMGIENKKLIDSEKIRQIFQNEVRMLSEIPDLRSRHIITSDNLTHVKNWIKSSIEVLADKIRRLQLNLQEMSRMIVREK
jgi:hypothetical protein